MECHGTALSNGWHSLKEKSNMVFSHISGGKRHEDIHMNEEQLLEVSGKCAKCHQSEHANWLAGGHSANYKDIFLDEKHNSMEQPYWDCFRCHGIFYDGNIYDLMEPISSTGPWHLKQPGKAMDATMPCLTCHKVHMESERLLKTIAMNNPKEIHYNRDKKLPGYGLYLRAGKTFLRADKLPVPKIFKGDDIVKVSDDPAQRLCIACHSPNAFHQAGSQDDRTPTGVHEGLSCIACHAPHSNNAVNSCKTCHPAISNCGIEVEKMNTTYFNKSSKNNIHFVKCTDCHHDKELYYIQ